MRAGCDHIIIHQRPKKKGAGAGGSTFATSWANPASLAPAWWVSTTERILHPTQVTFPLFPPAKTPGRHATWDRLGESGTCKRAEGAWTSLQLSGERVKTKDLLSLPLVFLPFFFLSLPRFFFPCTAESCRPKWETDTMESKSDTRFCTLIGWRSLASHLIKVTGSSD